MQANFLRPTFRVKLQGLRKHILVDPQSSQFDSGLLTNDAICGAL